MGLKYAKIWATTKKGRQLFWEKSEPRGENSGYADASALSFCGPQM